MKRLVTLMILAVLVCPALHAADESIDNPMYKSWAKFKVGAMAKYRQNMDAGGTKTESTISYTLAEVSPEKVVVEMAVSTVIAGNKMDMPATKMEFLAKVPKSDQMALQAGTPPGARESDEELTLGGAKIKCHVVEVTVNVGGADAVSKTYVSDDVPGTLVKSVSSMDKPLATVTTIELIEKKVP